MRKLENHLWTKDTAYASLQNFKSSTTHPLLQIYIDRYYTSVHMNYSMCKRKTFFCGTLRRGQRTNLPIEIMPGMGRKGAALGAAPTRVKTMKRGDVLPRYDNHGYLSPNSALWEICHVNTIQAPQWRLHGRTMP